MDQPYTRTHARAHTRTRTRARAHTHAHARTHTHTPHNHTHTPLQHPVVQHVCGAMCCTAKPQTLNLKTLNPVCGVMCCSAFRVCAVLWCHVVERVLLHLRGGMCSTALRGGTCSAAFVWWNVLYLYTVVYVLYCCVMWWNVLYLMTWCNVLCCTCV